MTEDLSGGSLCHGGAAVSYSHTVFLDCIPKRRLKWKVPGLTRTGEVGEKLFVAASPRSGSLATSWDDFMAEQWWNLAYMACAETCPSPTIWRVLCVSVNTMQNQSSSSSPHFHGCLLPYLFLIKLPATSVHRTFCFL